MYLISTGTDYADRSMCTFMLNGNVGSLLIITIKSLVSTCSI